MRNLVRKALSASLLALALAAAPARAWGPTGHEAVAYLAWQQMKPATRARVMQLLALVPTLTHVANGQTATIAGYPLWIQDLPAGLTQDQQNLYLFMRAATWADTIKHQWLIDSDIPPPGRTVESNIGYTDPESHGYWHFIDLYFTSDHSRLPPTPALNAVSQILAFRTDIASTENDTLKSYDLIWLLHIVGDVHQPLHAATRVQAGVGDFAANHVNVILSEQMIKEFAGPNLNAFPPSELHAFWDYLPGEGRPTDQKQAITFATGLPPASPAAVADTNPAHWARESFAMAKSDVYKNPVGPALGPYTMTEPYRTAAITDAQKRIALAGARLAKLLNENLK